MCAATIEAPSLHIRLKAATPPHLRAAHNVELSIPQTSGRNALRKLVHHLLSSSLPDDSSKPDFHFLALGEPLRTTLDKFLERRQLTAETTLDVTYYLPLPEPERKSSVQASEEWLSSVAVFNTGSDLNVLVGSFAGLPSVHTCANGNEGVVAIVDEGGIVKTAQGHTAPIKGVSWMRDGRRFITASSDQSARVWQLATTENTSKDDDDDTENNYECECVPYATFRTEDCGQPVSLSAIAVDYSTTKDRALVGGEDGSVWLLPEIPAQSSSEQSLSKTQVLKRKRTDTSSIPAIRLGAGSPGLPTSAVAFREEDNSAISTGFDAMVRVWDAETSSEKVTAPAGGKPIYDIAVGKTYFAVAAMDGAVRLVDGRLERGVVGACGRKGAHEGIVTGVAWMEEGRNCVTGGVDGIVRVWDTRAMVTPVRVVKEVHDGRQSFAVDAIKKEDTWCVFSAGADGKIARLSIG